ncbi:hypothetical protein F1559_002419 [Cyanidiococcus yangmingshanensis]|uniref:Uncharacterized protein n=1 Tax=Cyanidiococcus yangmingshanensis TaxID=2690220 RepID=A0A7J7IEE4_9RHOD|nr:hypothetical protein F1559_002419 [Cyanidiococcus yangmingshanensis]
MHVPWRPRTHAPVQTYGAAKISSKETVLICMQSFLQCIQSIHFASDAYWHQQFTASRDESHSDLSSAIIDITREASPSITDTETSRPRRLQPSTHLNRSWTRANRFHRRHQSQTNSANSQERVSPASPRRPSESPAGRSGRARTSTDGTGVGDATSRSGHRPAHVPFRIR